MQGMVHVYVIHLKHRTDRHRQFTEAWNAAGLSRTNVHWFPAVLGSALTSETLANFRTAARTREARAGRVGCYCSHVAAIRKAIARDHFPLLVLEDDAIPVPGEPTPDLSRAFAAAPSDATLLYFGALPVRARRRVDLYCTRWERGWGKPASDVQLYGGHAYGIPTAAAAAEIADYLDLHKITFDSALVRYRKEHPERVSVHCPFLFVQSEGYSDIEGAQRPQRGGPAFLRAQGSNLLALLSPLSASDSDVSESSWCGS
ncbi:MAG: glycosyltransferase family 25 protein [Betaproteobacteria bacterium]|nr:glycosyltransferase family 25 protein [Betaproteobacteria bacterium]